MSLALLFENKPLPRMTIPQSIRRARDWCQMLYDLSPPTILRISTKGVRFGPAGVGSDRVFDGHVLFGEGTFYDPSTYALIDPSEGWSALVERGIALVAGVIGVVVSRKDDVAFACTLLGLEDRGFVRVAATPGALAAMRNQVAAFFASTTYPTASFKRWTRRNGEARNVAISSNLPDVAMIDLGNTAVRAAAAYDVPPSKIAAQIMLWNAYALNGEYWIEARSVECKRNIHELNADIARYGVEWLLPFSHRSEHMSALLDAPDDETFECVFAKRCRRVCMQYDDT